MERQLKICNKKSRSEVNVGTEVINELLLYCHEQISQLELNAEQAIITTLMRRCFAMLNCHHEYRQLGQFSKNLQDVIDRNVAKAVAFLLACLDQMDPLEQMHFLLGEHDLDVCPPMSPTQKVINLRALESKDSA